MTRSVALALTSLAFLVGPGAGAQSPLAACVDGTAETGGVAYPCDDVDLMSFVPRSAFAIGGSGEAPHNDVWGWTDPQTGIEYALVGTENGTGFVSLENPAAPVVVGKLPTANGRQSVWRDVKVYDDHVFVVADGSPGHGVQVFDLTRLRGVASPPVLFEADAVYEGVGSSHNIVINEETGFAYAVGFGRGDSGGPLPTECGNQGFHAIDVRDPKNPTFAGCFSSAALEIGTATPGYTHDGQCVVYTGPDPDYQGREICIGANEVAVSIFDATDKDDVRTLSQVFYPETRYTHQGWLTPDQRYFLTNDELDEVRGGQPTQRTIVLDLEDLDDPEFSFVYDSGLTTIDHNLYVRGRLVFESNYEAGLRILDASQIGDGLLEEVAYFDTFPSRTTISGPCLPPQAGNCESFNGQWSNYPYFESGFVVANDRDRGLFVLRPAASLGVGNADGPALPMGYTLSAPRPNPSTGRVRLALQVAEAQHVRAELFDVAGRRLAVVYEGPVRPSGGITLSVSGAELPAGVYVLRVEGETFVAARRIVFTR